MFGLLLISCASEESLQSDWDAFTAEHQTCEVDEDCILVYPGCPLPCVDVISSDAVTEATQLANELVAKYEKLGRNCQYECAAYGTAYCDGGLCDIAEGEASAGN